MRIGKSSEAQRRERAEAVLREARVILALIRERDRLLAVPVAVRAGD